MEDWQLVVIAVVLFSLGIICWAFALGSAPVPEECFKVCYLAHTTDLNNGDYYEEWNCTRIRIGTSGGGL